MRVLSRQSIGSSAKNESYFNGRHVWCNNEEKIALNKGVLMLAQGGSFRGHNANFYAKLS
jgi:hypothetical protein